MCYDPLRFFLRFFDLFILVFLTSAATQIFNLPTISGLRPTFSKVVLKHFLPLQKPDCVALPETEENRIVLLFSKVQDQEMQHACTFPRVETATRLHFFSARRTSPLAAGRIVGSQLLPQVGLALDPLLAWILYAVTGGLRPSLYFFNSFPAMDPTYPYENKQ